MDNVEIEETGYRLRIFKESISREYRKKMSKCTSETGILVVQ